MSTLDANMGYFVRCLARQSRPSTVFCLPFGKFQFKRLAMGISTAPDEYQSYMERILGDISFVIVYLDDVLIFFGDCSGSFEASTGRVRVFAAIQCDLEREKVPHSSRTSGLPGLHVDCRRNSTLNKESGSHSTNYSARQQEGTVPVSRHDRLLQGKWSRTSLQVQLGSIA